MSNFKILGINDDQSSCCCCGKSGLKRVVWIENTETGDVRHFGTTCAASPAKAFGLGRELRKAIRDYTSAVKDRQRVERNEAIAEACRRAFDNYPGEWLEVAASPRMVAATGRSSYRVPADREQYEAHKKRMVDEALEDLAKI